MRAEDAKGSPCKECGRTIHTCGYLMGVLPPCDKLYEFVKLMKGVIV